MRTEDQVRDQASEILGLAGVSSKIAQSGVGQITTLKQLGFSGDGAINKPDGWYLPVDKGAVALVLETKAPDAMSVDAPILRAQIEKYCATVRSQYDLVVGIVYDGERTRAYANGQKLDVPDDLQPKEYYFDKLTDRPVDKDRIYELTMRINNSLHADFGVKNLYHRMIFTACALVARRYEAILVRGMDYAAFHGGILNALNKAIRSDVQQNSKLSLLSEVYSDIKMNVSTDEEDPRAVARLTNLIGDFIDWVTEISGLINSNAWNGEDVMAIFFNEFNRYKKKSESGQVFTPDHITGFMYRLLGVDKDDRVLDACAGSGSFLVKAMSSMISEAGGVNTPKAKQIKAQQLFGIEFDREIYALACANMLIHKDGKTNLAHMDARTETAGSWIAQTGATKVLMNPPYETKFGCMKIVENVLNNVDRGTLCGFILPDKKLEKTSKSQMARILRHHRLMKVVKLPENLFFGVGVTTSIFVFESGKPQDGKKFFAVNIEDDGLITVKNKGRHDVRRKWPALEDYWIDAIDRSDDSHYGTGQWVDPAEKLSWQAPAKPFVLAEEDLARTSMDYAMFRRGVDARALRESIGRVALYSAHVRETDETIVLEVPKSDHEVDVSKWKTFMLSDVFDMKNTRSITAANLVPDSGLTPYVTAQDGNNGVQMYVDCPDEWLDAGECIMIGGKTLTLSYQAADFCSNDSHNIALSSKDLESKSESCQLFLMSVLSAALSPKYSWGDSISMKVLQQESLLLPVTPAGIPDWEFMRNMMQTVTDRMMENLNALTYLVDGVPVPTESVNV
ncbi:Restriction enzyme BgcI subunit alpha [Arthrobacter sp. Bi83]|uniref:N-6 DNA methylase n=1 Tax=Arthrobacter sp. Bi83 TaxID=2822353 RepID=UPI001D388823|nr:N-6 DNA methylase [Arthrobacter sp. Bi83]CAH0158981.1 Restriction enzyme BgcI subunit alpha [Arthrobacter sp. Bi83]